MTDVVGGVAGPVVLAESVDGCAVLPTTTPLMRLNFFDGRRLSATDLDAEQEAGRELTFAVGRGLGSGISSGFDVLRAGESLTVTPGLGRDGHGRQLLLTQPVTLTVDRLLTCSAVGGVLPTWSAGRGLGTATGKRLPFPQPRSRAGTGGAADRADFAPCELGIDTPVETVAGDVVLVLTVGWADGRCGTAEVFGAPCTAACITDLDREFRVDGIVLRVRRLVLESDLPTSTAVALLAQHLRSRVAAAYFADERGASPDMSGTILRSTAWCRGTPETGGAEVPLALIGRSGASTTFTDVWTARRERIELPGRGAFDVRIRARPRSVFTAQLAQFQCQLADVLAAALPEGAQQLVDAGVVEVPSAGYLPVVSGEDVLDRAQRLLGPGVDLRPVPMPPDQVPHEVEAVQHRDRIPLLPGIDDPAQRMPVDLLVPDGAVRRTVPRPRRPVITSLTVGAGPEPFRADGVARLTPRTGGGFTLSAAVLGGAATPQGAVAFVESLAGLVTGEPLASAPAPAREPLDLFALQETASLAGEHAARARADARVARVFATPVGPEEAQPVAGRGELTVDADPWRLARGAMALLTAGLDVYAPGGNAAAVAFDAVGRVEALTGPLPDGTARFRFTGQVTVTTGGREPDTEPVTAEAEVGLLELPGRRAWSVHVPGLPPLTVEQADGETVVRGGDVVVLRLGAVAAEAAPVAERIERAGLALGLLRGARVDDPEFLERARSATFGADLSPPVVTTGLDWVAFRRRSVERVRPTPVNRPVTVWVGITGGPDEAARLTEVLRGGKADARQFRRMGTVLFPEDGADLVTAATEVQAAYAATGAPPLLRFTGVAPAEMPLGGDRARRVIDALGALLDATGSEGIATIVQAPDGTLEQGTDGSFFLVVHPAAPQRTAVLEVVTLDMTADPRLAKLADAALRQSDSGRFEPLIGGAAVRSVGLVTIADGKPDVGQTQAAIKGASLAVQGRTVEDLTPLLWIDKAWSAEDPASADALQGLAKEISARIRLQASPPQLELRNSVVVGLDVTRRNGLLVVEHRPSIN